MKLWKKKYWIKLDTTKGEKQNNSKSTGHEIKGNDPLNQIIDRVTHLTLLLGSLFCSSNTNHKHICQSRQFLPLNDAADLAEHH